MRSNLLEAAAAEELPTPVLAKHGQVARIGPGPDAWKTLSMDCEARTDYRVSFSQSLSTGAALCEAVAGRKALLVTTPTVNRLYGGALRAGFGSELVTLVIDVREETKSMRYVEQVCAAALSQRLDRKSLLIGFGGGVCLDIVTLSASLVRRGIGHVRIPTTLIGQIDAGIGLKGAVNFAGKKSFVGCFHPPEQVLIDPSYLQTLPRRSRSSGVAEAVKMGIVRDALLFEALEANAEDFLTDGFDSPEGHAVLRRSVWSMLDELRKNPFEDQTFERYVDFGHTFSPSLEAALGFDIQHGEAVAIDMALSAVVAKSLGLLAKTGCERILALLQRASLPIHSSALDLALCREGLAEAARHRGGCVNLVVPSGIGQAVFLKRGADLDDAVIEHALRTLRERAA